MACYPNFGLPSQRVSASSWLRLAGGLAVIERPGQPRLDLGELGASLAQVKALHPELELWLEPGRYVVSEGGCCCRG
ncbi:MAG: hypothetical protein RBU37_12750 [Myxococcota bacterium]|nr:hypothetical protein [Myxococcota bacterium]